ncbi:hypothetical protein Tco_1378272 [Tanacetum coccineum]
MLFPKPYPRVDFDFVLTSLNAQTLSSRSGNVRFSSIFNPFVPLALIFRALSNSALGFALILFFSEYPIQDQGVIDNGCLRHMTRNMSYHNDFEEMDEGYVAFGGNPKGGNITGVVKGNCRGYLQTFLKLNQPVLLVKRESNIELHITYGVFDSKADEDYLWYSFNSKKHLEYSSVDTRIVEENCMLPFTSVAENQPNGNAGTKACDDACKAKMETVPGKDYILLPLWPADPPFSQSSKSSPDAGFKPSEDDKKKVTKEPGKEGGNSSEDSESNDQEKDGNVNSTNTVNAASTNEVNVVGAKTSIELPDDITMPELDNIVYSDDNEDVGAEADMKNLDTFMPVSPIPTTRIHKDHPVEQIIRDLNSAPQTRRMTKNLEEHGWFSSVKQRTNQKDFQNCLFAHFLSQEEPKKVIHALKDPSWIKAMQEEIL